MVTFVIVLDHVVSFKGIEVYKVKIKAIFKLPQLKIDRDVRFFLGYAEFYKKFIKNIVSYLNYFITSY